MYVLDVYSKKQTHVDNSLFDILNRVQSHVVVEMYYIAVLHFTLNVHCGPVCGGQRVGASLDLLDLGLLAV
jgi:hypothetical protein